MANSTTGSPKVHAAKTPTQIAEAHSDPTHPSVVKRLSEEARALAANYDTADAASFASDESYDSLRILLSSADRFRRDVEKHRRQPTVYPRI